MLDFFAIHINSLTQNQNLLFFRKREERLIPTMITHVQALSFTNTPRFHGRNGDDYGLWLLKLRAACRIKRVWDIEESKTFVKEGFTSTKISDANKENVRQYMQTASGMITSALGSTPLRAVADADDQHVKVLELLDVRYASNRTVSRIAVQTQLYRRRYYGQNMSKYIDQYSTLFTRKHLWKRLQSRIHTKLQGYLLPLPKIQRLWTVLRPYVLDILLISFGTMWQPH